MITAIVLVHVEADRIPEVAEAIAALEGVSEVYSVTGGADLIAMVRVREHEALADVIADRLSKVDGVRRPRRTSPSAPTPSTTWTRPSPSAPRAPTRAPARLPPGPERFRAAPGKERTSGPAPAPARLP